MAHEFIRAIIEDRQPAVDAVTAAYITGAGICAHQSALQGGETIHLPDFHGTV
jgi:hypothetical protein